MSTGRVVIHNLPLRASARRRAGHAVGMNEYPDELPVLRLREPGDLIEAVPYLLGFHPRQSLVIIGLARASVALTTRVDLNELPSQCAADTPQRPEGREWVV